MLCFIAFKDAKYCEVTMQVVCDTGKTILHKLPKYYDMCLCFVSTLFAMNTLLHVFSALQTFRIHRNSRSVAFIGEEMISLQLYTSALNGRSQRIFIILH